MKAALWLRRRVVVAEDAFAEVVIWWVPQPVAPSQHEFKYSLAYVVRGECVFRYDNERGKGDHRHMGTDGRFRGPVVLDVRSLAETLKDAARVMDTGHGEDDTRISFAAPELLWKVLTAKRWELLKSLCGAGPISIRGAARRIGRDVKAVHGDVKALLDAGIL